MGYWNKNTFLGILDLENGMLVVIVNASSSALTDIGGHLDFIFNEHFFAGKEGISEWCELVGRPTLQALRGHFG